MNFTGIDRCPPPFLEASLFGTTQGYVEGRVCQTITNNLHCCLPCPMSDWVYPDNFNSVVDAVDWIAVVSVICCVLLLLSWAFLPVEKTNRHYLSICFTIGILLMNLGFVVPLAAQPEQCFDSITPNDMRTSKVCGASASLLILGGWCGVMWAFLRSLSLHLQICWQVLVGRSFMFFAQAAGWGIPIIGIILALVFSGVSFRFGATCHINHNNSLADLWIPLLIFSGITVIITFATFGYCVKVYLESLSDTSTSTDGSSLPTYSNSVVTMSPRQAYRRIRRVIALQWRGIAIVLIIVVDVIFFSIVLVFQDQTMQKVAENPAIAQDWIVCLIGASGDKNQCLHKTGSLVVGEATVAAVLVLLTLNGIWLFFLLGRWTMLTGWIDLVNSLLGRKQHKEFVSVDARYDMKQDTRSYEMLSRQSSVAVTPKTPVKSPMTPKTPEFVENPYQPPARSYSNPRPPQRTSWDAQQMYAPGQGYEDMNPLGMNRI
ncbi:hypothetical protein PT974_08953 [Cladobotryum mycophilum]|uniref:G-protein coupled receptors family 2 profile 2 domain-containing protein n=1 Tax=Cladobotryum mycophilum TaxID=491253 RepID=A0ABR0SEW8_9HYPO